MNLVASEFAIGTVAKRVGVTNRTIRFYEKRGLFWGLLKRSGRDRVLTAVDVRRLELIVQLTTMGFALREIEALITPGDEPALDIPPAVAKKQYLLMLDRQTEVQRGVDLLKSYMRTQEERAAGQNALPL